MVWTGGSIRLWGGEARRSIDRGRRYVLPLCLASLVSTELSSCSVKLATPATLDVFLAGEHYSQIYPVLLGRVRGSTTWRLAVDASAIADADKVAASRGAALSSCVMLVTIAPYFRKIFVCMDCTLSHPHLQLQPHSPWSVLQLELFTRQELQADSQHLCSLATLRTPRHKAFAATQSALCSQSMFACRPVIPRSAIPSPFTKLSRSWHGWSGFSCPAMASGAISA